MTKTTKKKIKISELRQLILQELEILFEERAMGVPPAEESDDYEDKSEGEWAALNSQGAQYACKDGDTDFNGFPCEDGKVKPLRASEDSKGWWHAEMEPGQLYCPPKWDLSKYHDHCVPRDLSTVKLPGGLAKPKSINPECEGEEAHMYPDACPPPITPLELVVGIVAMIEPTGLVGVYEAAYYYEREESAMAFAMLVVSCFAVLAGPLGKPIRSSMQGSRVATVGAKASRAYANVQRGVLKIGKKIPKNSRVLAPKAGEIKKASETLQNITKAEAQKIAADLRKSGINIDEFEVLGLSRDVTRSLDAIGASTAVAKGSRVSMKSLDDRALVAMLGGDPSKFCIPGSVNESKTGQCFRWLKDKLGNIINPVKNPKAYNLNQQQLKNLGQALQDTVQSMTTPTKAMPYETMRAGTISDAAASSFGGERILSGIAVDPQGRKIVRVQLPKLDGSGFENINFMYGSGTSQLYVKPSARNKRFITADDLEPMSPEWYPTAGYVQGTYVKYARPDFAAKTARRDPRFGQVGGGYRNKYKDDRSMVQWGDDLENHMTDQFGQDWPRKMNEPEVKQHMQTYLNSNGGSERVFDFKSGKDSKFPAHDSVFGDVVDWLNTLDNRQLSDYFGVYSPVNQTDMFDFTTGNSTVYTHGGKLRPMKESIGLKDLKRIIIEETKSVFAGEHRPYPIIK